MASPISSESATAAIQEKYARSLNLDHPKLVAASASDQGEVFLLTWLSGVEEALSRADIAIIRNAQQRLEQDLLHLISPPTDEAEAATTSDHPKTASAQIPKPGRPIRHRIARCFVLLFTRAESRSLFDICQTLLRTAGDEGKGKRIEKEAKTASLYVLGEIFAAMGHNVMSVFLEITATTQRIFKNTSQPVILRFHALSCLQKALSSGAKSLNDQPAKELVKSLRQGLADKAGAVVRGCSECLLTLLEKTDYLGLRSEIEAILGATFKALDGVDYLTKRALSRLTAGLLASTQAEGSAPLPAPSKKTTKKNKQKDAAGGADSEEEEAAAAATASASSKALLTPSEMLDQLAQPFQKSSALNRVRVAVLDFYSTLFVTLGTNWVQLHYDVILDHLINVLPNQSRSVATRADVLLVRTGVNLILRSVIGERMLGEAAQVEAVRQLCDTTLRRYPVVMPGQPPPPSKYTLTLALGELAGLLRQLGAAPAQVVDALYEPLLRCLGHPSHTVQVSAAWCLRTFCEVEPAHLSATTKKLIELLSKDLVSLTSAGDRGGAELPKRTGGHARALAALVSVVPSRALYTSFDVSSQVLDLAVKLLKDCGNHSLAISGVEIQVAWTLLSALMSLGPNFVRPSLSQLLLLWRNALPRPTPQEGAPGAPMRSDAEWAFLLHVRESALSCIWSFLNFNSDGLLTLDTARRIIALLSNTLAFVDGFSSLHPQLRQEQSIGSDGGPLTLLDREHMLRRRIFQCFTALSSNAAIEPLQSSLVSVTLQTFAEPDRYIGSAAQAAIAASAGSFTSLWSLSDGYAFGVSSLQRDDETFIALDAKSGSIKAPAYDATSHTARADLLNRDSIEVQIDALQRRPILGAPEHDPLVLCARYGLGRDQCPLPPPPITAMVDAAMELFAALVPFQKRDIQIAAFETMLSYCRSSRLERNPGRRTAVQINSCVAALGALKTAMRGTVGVDGQKAAGFNNDRMTTALREILKDALLLGDSVLRVVSSSAYGRLAAVAGSHAMSGQVQFLVDQVVSNRNPDARAGCALAFGAVYSEVGGLAAGPLTKTVVNVLMSLSSDPHPTVHYSALEALRLVVDAASLSYSPYLTSTLGMLLRLYILDTHEPEGGSAGSVNLRADLPAQQAMCRVISALVGVLGPDLEHSGKIAQLIYAMLYEFSREKDDGVVVEATKATQHYSLFASQQLDVADWISRLTDHLRSRKRPMKLAAINGFYQLVQRQALVLSKVGGDALVADLFAQLDLEPSMDGVREVLLSWLRQTADLSPGSWIDICQRIMSRVAKTSGAKGPEQSSSQQPSSMLQDEEAATLNLDGDANAGSAALQGSRWRTQLFALQCLHEVFLVVRRSGRLEHFEAPRPGLTPQQSRALMSSRVVDLIRMAFTASTAANAEIRLQGLVVLRDVIDNFRLAKDPDFADSLLLEQHQAPIAAALTPAFLADSTPEVLAAALQVCAAFVGSGVVREVGRMGRILKQLVTALQSCTDQDMDSLGDVKNLSPNAAAMLKVAVFTAWGELEVACASQPYLVAVVQPHLATLAPYWIASLRDYAKIKTDPDSSSAGLGLDTVGVVVNPFLDSEYAGLARETLMPYYQDTWYIMLDAVTSLMRANFAGVVEAMNGGQSEPASNSEPLTFFFVLYGLAFEALAVNAGGSVLNNVEAVKQTRIMSTALQSISSLANPKYAGTAILRDASCEELCKLCYRVVMTESLAIQVGVVELLASFAKDYGQRLVDGSSDAQAPSALLASGKATQILQIVVFVIHRSRLQRGSTEDKAALLRSAYSAYVLITETCLPSLKDELYASAFCLYSEMLRDEKVEGDLVSPTLSCLRELCEKASQTNSSIIQRALHGFLSSALNTIDEVRGRSSRGAINKTKNCFISSTIILTSLPGVNAQISRSVLEQLCYLIISRLADLEQLDDIGKEIALTAVNCGRMLILTAARSDHNPVLQFCTGQLLPGLVEVVTRSSPNLHTNDVKGIHYVVVSEIYKTFEGLLNALPESESTQVRARLLTVLLPSLTVHLYSASPSTLHALTVKTLLSFATHSPAAFREAASKMQGQDKVVLESSIRAAIQQQQQNGRTDAGPRTPREGGAQRAGGGIALKSFGAK